MALENYPHLCLRDARVQAFAWPIVDYPEAFKGGPVLENDAHRIFRHHRYGRVSDAVRPDQTYEDRLAGDYVYAGPVFDHFGHFMAEMAHRIVPAQTLGLPHRFLFVAMQDDARHATFQTLPRFMREVLDLCGLGREDVAIVNRNTIVERLHLVEQGASLGSYPKPGYLDVLRERIAPRLDALLGPVERPQRLYVSRSALSKAGGFLGESYVEAHLERAGFSVFRPERHSLPVQMDHYRKAECVVFPGGSACHGAELLGTGMLRNAVFVPRLDYQSYLYTRVLKPRALATSRVPLSRYLGTLLINASDGSPSEHRGVSVFEIGRLSGLDAAAGRAVSPGVSRLGYARAAARDLAAYGREVDRAGGDRNGVSKLSLAMRFLRMVVFAPRADPADAAPATPVRRILTMREVAAIWLACGALPEPFRAFFRVSLLSLQQQPHVAGLRWSELSPDRETWTIPAARTKDGLALDVRLAEPVRAILAALPRAPGTDLVFHTGGKPMRGLPAAKQALDAEILRLRATEAGRDGGEPAALVWSPLELRRTGVSRLKELGFDGAAIRPVLGLAVIPEEDSDPAGTPGGYSADASQVLKVWAADVLASARTYSGGIEG